MVISDRYRYVFVEVPMTASTAIARELCEQYDGHVILRKHASYNEFLRHAPTEARRYLLVAGVRNPLDQAVSLYEKLRTDHKGAFTSPDRFERQGGWVSNRHLKMRAFIRNDADFPTFFRAFFGPPRVRVSQYAWTPRAYDVVIRFESIQADFARFVERIGAPSVRPLPVINKTGEKQPFLSYYTPDLYDRARSYFGPCMEQWGYAFPEEWGEKPVPRRSRVAFNLINGIGHAVCNGLRVSPDDLIRVRRRLSALANLGASASAREGQ